MNEILLLVVILLPILSGIAVPLFNFKNRKSREIFLETLVILNSILVWFMLLNAPENTFVLARFTGNLSIAFKLDGLGMVFAGLVSALWPFAT